MTTTTTRTTKLPSLTYQTCYDRRLYYHTILKLCCSIRKDKSLSSLVTNHLIKSKTPKLPLWLLVLLLYYQMVFCIKPLPPMSINRYPITMMLMHHGNLMIITMTMYPLLLIRLVPAGTRRVMSLFYGTFILMFRKMIYALYLRTFNRRLNVKYPLLW